MVGSRSTIEAMSAFRVLCDVGHGWKDQTKIVSKGVDLEGAVAGSNTSLIGLMLLLLPKISMLVIECCKVPLRLLVNDAHR